jgi:hypothetical protein
MIYDFGGQDDRRERHDIEFGIEISVLVYQLGNRDSAATEARVTEEFPSALIGQRGQRVRSRAFRRNVDADNPVPGIGDALADFAAEARLSEDRDSKPHGRPLRPLIRT